MKEERFLENPFLKDMVIPVKGKSVAVGNLEKVLGENNEVSVMDSSSGEVLGTSVSVFRKVDSQQFVKLFSHRIGSMLNLTAAGNKVICLLVWGVQNGIEKDVLTIDVLALESFLKYHPDTPFTQSTMMRGLRELCTAKVLAKHQRRGDYWINPDFIFNGNRITFVETLVNSGAVDIPRQEGNAPQFAARLTADQQIDLGFKEAEPNLIEDEANLARESRVETTENQRNFEVDNFLKGDE